MGTNQAKFINLFLWLLFIFAIIVVWYGIELTLTGGNSGLMQWESFINRFGGIATIIATVYTGFTIQGKNRILLYLVKGILYLTAIFAFVLAFFVKIFPFQLQEFIEALHGKTDIFLSAHILSGLSLLSLCASLLHYGKIKKKVDQTNLESPTNSPQNHPQKTEIL
ncbi:hypothetical protein QPK24_15665 [Paenibacillus polygoni]|uniref:DUF4149 domain-containing protein n=1 Tax=Paenibacillus polygoni TaxID=3050112 RepID=A0ABY8X3P1_9BACL|nr:hypothetical protein [Paenibacillus polygoni]WIV17845.1 hypothetical protein QPK24_15665 [Paenibacillus polygoni]